MIGGLCKRRQGKLNSLIFGIHIIILALAFSYPAQARVVVKEQTIFYNVQGTTGRAISRGFGIRKASSRSSLNFGGSHAIARTDFVVEVKNIKKIARNNHCRVTNADIVVSVKYTLPNWIDKAKASPNMRREWAKFMDYVIWHEKHHVTLAREFAGQYLQLVKQTKYPLLANCSSLPEKEKARLKKLVKLHQQKQKLFDRRENQISGKSRLIQAAFKRAK